MTLEAVGVFVDYDTPAGRVRALDDVTVTALAGTSLAIVGPSGCGKSTLLGVLGGLEVPAAGSVRVDGEIISGLSDSGRAAVRRKSFGFVFQADNLQPFLTVSENVALQAALAGAVDAPDQVQFLLDALDVGTLGHRFPDQLSGGQRQRVAVARALVHRPSIVLADEPTGALDAANSDAVVELLLDVHRLFRTTLVVVTHDRSVAERMEDVVFMRDGRVTGERDRP